MNRPILALIVVASLAGCTTTKKPPASPPLASVNAGNTPSYCVADSKQFGLGALYNGRTCSPSSSTMVYPPQPLEWR
jgi:hypothetical protein